MQNIVTWPYVLRRGHSNNPAEGACAMDAINWLVHGEHGDMPECACPIIGEYVIVGNDLMPADVRQRLLPYLHRIAGSRSAKHELGRTEILVRAAVRVFAPNALDAAGLYLYAAALRNFPLASCAKVAAEAQKVAQEFLGQKRGAMNVALDTSQVTSIALAMRTMNAAYQAASAVVYILTKCIMAAPLAARAAAHAQAWDDYFAVLDEVLNAGPQGEPWSADVIEHGQAAFEAAGGKAALVE